MDEQRIAEIEKDYYEWDKWASERGIEPTPPEYILDLIAAWREQRQRIAELEQHLYAGTTPLEPIADYEAMQKRIAELETETANLDRNADALADMVMQRGQRIAELEAERDGLRALVKRLAAAMRYSEDVGCTDHLDACEDAGEFWYRAIDAAEAVEQRAEPEGEGA